MARYGKMTTVDEAEYSAHQHTQPCHDCPFRRDALRGWLGGSTPEEYRAMAHQDVVIDCHAIRGPQCAGVAIYRANVAKRCEPPMLKLPADRTAVFATPMEFLEHHTRKPAKPKKKRKA